MTIARVNRNVHPSPTPTPSPTFACGYIVPLLLGYKGVMGDVVEINEVADVVSVSVDVSVGVVSVVFAGVKFTPMMMMLIMTMLSLLLSNLSPFY
ncbi:hypothetical protein BDV36DRAFT_253720 [Aspergillus pseudocaelatus]|uniref:Uncharacterized protein n=1 Tax=Aspergillus pseudocaelatus TaxID=1825620 RepID=A0ABQ6WNA2_9EURO|nr:hypothetical protein BDV36DRAFT_253720 [Aspergillus pseudocaelatus]